MSESMRVSAIRIWAGLAWCDVSMSVEEELALRRLIDNSTALTDEEKQAAHELVQPVKEGDGDSAQALKVAERFVACGLPVRRGIYQAAMFLATADESRQSGREQRYLAGLRDALRLSADDVRDLLPNGISSLDSTVRRSAH